LGFTNKPPTRLQARSEWDASRSALESARQQAASLHREAEQLIALERARDEAGLARDDITRIEASRRVCEAQERGRAIEAQLNALPACVGDLTGRESDDAELLLGRWRQLSTSRARATRQREHAAQAMRALFAQRVPTDAERLVWRALSARLREHDGRCERDERSVRASEAERDLARQLCGTLATDAQLATLDTSSLDTLVAFARRYELAFGALRAAEQHQQALSAPEMRDSPAAHLSAESLRDLVRVLTRWLAADARRSARTTSFDVWWWWLLAVGLLGWILLAVRWHRAALAGAALVVLIVLLARIARNRETPEVALLQREYNTLGGAPLVEWSNTHVPEALDATIRALADARTRESDDIRRANAKRAMVHARATLEPLDAERDALVTHWGVFPDADAQTLPWFVHQLVTWSDAHREVVALEAGLAVERELRTSTHRELCTLFAEHGVSVNESTAGIDGMLGAMDARCVEHRDALRACDDADRELRSLHVEMTGLATAWRVLLERAAISVLELPEEIVAAHEPQFRHTLDTLDTLSTQRGQFQELSQRHRDAMRDRDAAGAPYVGDDAFHALQQRSPDETALALTAAITRAAAYADCVERVVMLRHRVDSAKQAHGVEVALARLTEHGAELERAQQTTLDALVGNAVLEHVQQQTRDVHRPAVFHRARALFARITHGRWQLTLEERETGRPGFRAIDSRTLRECPLDELSSGTRVQLLVAVRMAFVESTEGTVRIPLFLDEALGTSDDHRAQALIDAALELASDGRQLFYFTAQRDEVEKWRVALAGREIAWKEFDLAGIRRGYERDGGTPPSAVRVVSPPRIALPDPALHTHASFGTDLTVPVLHPGLTPAGATHPWYVIDDVCVLHDVLLLGINAWGELQLYLDAGGHFPEARASREACAVAFAQARLLMRAVEVLHREARIGRGEPVDRTRLVEADVMSARLLDAVSAVAMACAGDARGLLERLGQGEVPGFGAQRVRALRDRLQEIGCLDEAAPRTGREIRVAMLAAVSDALPARAVDALVARIASLQG